MRNAAIFAAAVLLAGCGIKEPQTVTAESLSLAPGRSAAFPIEVDASRMNVPVRTGTAQCGGFTFPLDGAPAFEGAMRDAVAAAEPRPTPARVRVIGDGIVPRFAFAPAGFAQPASQPTVLVTARVIVEPRNGPSRESAVQWTGQASGNIGDFCGGLGYIVADAYRDALRGLAGQVTERVRSAR